MRGGFRFINGCYGRKAKRTCRPRRELLLDRNIYKVDPNAPKESSPIFCENCGDSSTTDASVKQMSNATVDYANGRVNMP